jgi:hypothetical protein
MIHRIPPNNLSSLWKGRPGGISERAVSKQEAVSRSQKVPAGKRK